MQGEVIV